MEYSVTHNHEASRFEIHLENGQTAYMDYNETDLGLNFAHTYVPKSFEGRGIAAAIVKFALEYVGENDISYIASCPFVRVYLQRHPEYHSLRKEKNHSEETL